MNSITTLRQPGEDALSDTDYRDMFDELRAGKSLDKLIAFMALCQQDNPTHVSTNKVIWWRYEKGETGLTWSMKNDLRCASGLAPLPAQVVDIVAARVDPNATVEQVGEGSVHLLVLVADGAVGAGLPEMAQPVTISNTARNSVDVPLKPRTRKPRGTIEVPAELFHRANQIRTEQGKSWTEMLEMFLLWLGTANHDISRDSRD